MVQVTPLRRTLPSSP